MPYIKKMNRPGLDDNTRQASNAGELNYCITRLCDDYMSSKGKSYAIINEIVGVLECAKLELYRKIAAKYEDGKCANPENGEVYKNI